MNNNILIAQGGNGWSTPLLECCQQIHAAGFKGVSLPYYPFTGLDATPTLPSDPETHAKVTQWCLQNGMLVWIPIHCDNGRQNIPFSMPGTYLAKVTELLKALSAMGVARAGGAGATPGQVAIIVGNENLPTQSRPDRPTGNNPWTWNAINALYGDLWKQCIGQVRNLLPGAKAGLPGPGDEGPAYWQQAAEFYVPSADSEVSTVTPVNPRRNLNADIVRACNADFIGMHYPAENAGPEGNIDYAALIAGSQQRYANDIYITECAGDKATPLSIGATMALNLPIAAWQWQCPGGFSLRDHPELLQALGAQTTTPNTPLPLGPAPEAS